MIAAGVVGFAACSEDSPTTAGGSASLSVRVAFPEPAAAPAPPSLRATFTRVRAFAFRIGPNGESLQAATATPVSASDTSFELSLAVGAGSAYRVLVDALGPITDPPASEGILFAGEASTPVLQKGTATEIQVALQGFVVDSIDVRHAGNGAIPCREYELRWAPLLGAQDYIVEETPAGGGPADRPTVPPALRVPWPPDLPGGGTFVGSYRVRGIGLGGFTGAYDSTYVAAVQRPVVPITDLCWSLSFAPAPAGQGIGQPQDGGSVLTAVSLGTDLVVAGTGLVQAGPTPIGPVAAWDGASWRPLGSPSDFAAPGGRLPEIRAATVINGELIVGGLFSSPANGVARWDGVSWSGLGRTGGLPRVVNALTVYNGQLVAGCDADSSQFAPDFDVAVWDGASWSPIGPPGAGLDPFVCVVRALTVYGGQLVAGGFFPSPGGPALFAASYDGIGWNVLGQGGPDGEVFTLSVFGTELVAGGLFTSVDGVPAPYIARFGTTWSAFDQFFDEFVSTTTVHQGVLYAGGGFTSPAGRVAGGFPVGIARWDGFKWVGLGSGLQFFGESANTIVSHQGSLWIAGSFERAGQAASEKIARWDGG